MGSIIIALPKADTAEKIAGMIRSQGMPFDVNICDTAASVLRISNSREYGVVICSKRLKDMGYIEMADMLPTNFSTIILTNDASVETVRDDMVKLLAPFRGVDLLDTIEMLCAKYIRRPRKKQQAPPKRSEEEQKTIGQAKALLMERNGMSEPEAFRYIQKNSMDYGRKLIESAQMILTLYSEAGHT